MAEHFHYQASSIITSLAGLTNLPALIASGVSSHEYKRQAVQEEPCITPEQLCKLVPCGLCAFHDVCAILHFAQSQLLPHYKFVEKNAIRS